MGSIIHHTIIYVMNIIINHNKSSGNNSFSSFLIHHFSFIISHSSFIHHIIISCSINYYFIHLSHFFHLSFYPCIIKIIHLTLFIFHLINASYKSFILSCIIKLFHLIMHHKIIHPFYLATFIYCTSTLSLCE